MPHATRLAQITRARLRAGTSVRVALAPNSAFTSRTGRVKSVLLCDDPAQNILMAANSNSTPSWHSNRICATTATGLWTTAQGRANIAAAGWAIASWASSLPVGADVGPGSGCTYCLAAVMLERTVSGRFRVSGRHGSGGPAQGPGPGTLGELACGTCTSGGICQFGGSGRVLVSDQPPCENGPEGLPRMTSGQQCERARASRLISKLCAAARLHPASAGCSA